MLHSIRSLLLKLCLVHFLLFTNSYKTIEKVIIAFVSIIGLSFLYELSLVNIDWQLAAKSWIVPTFPKNSMLIIMSVLGAVVMPHNLFLHSEVIQSREWNMEDEKVIEKQLKYEFFDTLFSMSIGWAINSAMILIAAAVFFKNGILVEELEQAQIMMEPLLGSMAAVLFAIALLESLKAGFGGVVIGHPADKKLYEHYIERLGAKDFTSSALARNYEYTIILEGMEARELYEKYTFNEVKTEIS